MTLPVVIQISFIKECTTVAINPKSNSLQPFACAVGMYMIADAVAAVLSTIMAIIVNIVMDLIKTEFDPLM
jgi:hypothetical protein